MELNLIDDQGKATAKVSASDATFGREFNEALVHQLVTAYLANGRSGTRAQKDRGEVKHSTKKPWRQKGTGRARAGMTSSPLWRGGGRIFPNRPYINRLSFQKRFAVSLSAVAKGLHKPIWNQKPTFKVGF